MALNTAYSASIVFDDPPHSDGIRVIQGVPDRATGTNMTVVPTDIGSRRCVRPVANRRPRRQMGWWRNTTEDAEGVDHPIALKLAEPPTGTVDVYVTIEFFDAAVGWIGVHYERDGEGFVHHVCTHERERTWEHTWINTADSQTWQKAIVPLTAARFEGKGPLGCDIEIVGSEPVFLRSVSVSTTRPADFDSFNLDAHARRLRDELGPRYAKASVPVSVGNIASIFEDSDISSAYENAPWLPIYRACGVTSIQSYVRWSSIERKENEWTWGIYDWTVEQAKRFDMKWVAFIMIGPHYAMPDWWLVAGNDYRNKCLEHSEESWVQSIWSPVMLAAVDRFMKKFSEHYDHDIIESIMLGIAGDFGESTTNGVFIRKLYHTHVGHWCGEDVAVEDLRRTMSEKYGDIDALNTAWGASYTSFTEIRPVMHEDALSDRAWLDQMDWYVDRMTWWMARWGEITRAALPNTVIYNAAGGAGDPPRAASWSDQSKVLVPTNVGHRATNEGSDYAFNFAYTSWIGTACRFYGLPFGNEPWGGDMSGNGDLGRMFNAVNQNATNLWFYSGHVRPPSGRLALQRGLPFVDGTYRRANRVAVYYPWTHFLLRDEHGFSEIGRRDIFWPQIEELRDIIDFDLVDKTLVADGILDEYDFVIVLQGTTYEQDELERLAAWVKSGGVLITHNLGLPATVEGDTSIGETLFAGGKGVDFVGGRVNQVGAGYTVLFPHRADRRGWRRDERWADDHPDHPATHPAFWGTITATFANASKIGAKSGDYPVVDGAKNEVYASIFDRDIKGNVQRGLLCFSQAQEDVVIYPILPDVGRKTTVVPAGQMIFVPFDSMQ